MYVVFARKYRPQRFEEVVGQDHITTTLRNAVRTGRVAHAYLFCGSRGVGKTTVARILAKALNCKEGPTAEPCCECEPCRHIAEGHDIDVMEIDGASNTGVDNIRQLRQNAGLSPARSRYKVYYIDEVHMLSDSAFNALLKTLEEPPPHVKFIFSTTEPRKLPETVRSRCQRFDFHRIADGQVLGLLREVCTKEGLQVEEGGLPAIARAARGSIRDALGALDQLAAFGEEIALSDVLAVLGAVETGLLTEMVDAFAAEDTSPALELLEKALSGGTAVDDFADQMGRYLRDLLIASYCGPEAAPLAGAAADAETLRRQCELFAPDRLIYMIQLLREAGLRARREVTGRIALELAVVKMSRLSDLMPLEEALQQLKTGGEAPSRQSAPTHPEEASENPGDGARTVGVLRRMQQKLKKKPSSDEPGGEKQNSAPNGMNPARYRELVASAEDADVAREALEQKPLVQAFLQADQTLGLSPQKLSKGREPEQTEREQSPEEE